MISSEHVAQRLASVRGRIAAAGGDPDRVTVVAVTKGFGVDAVRAAVAAGLDHIGESYAQEASPKLSAVEDLDPVVHFVGRTQTNKVRQLAPLVDVWQAVDRPRLVRELVRRAAGAQVMVQLNLSGDPGKGGCAPDEAPRLVEEAADAGLAVAGLMGVGSEGDPDATRRGFDTLVSMADRLGVAERSIGMTHDLEAAVAAGSTMVRVGTALFGARPTRGARA